MTQIDAVGATRGGAGVWIFRVLLIAGAAFMVYSWFAPWWSAKLSVIPGDNHLVLRPWGIDAAGPVRANADASLYSMPWFFAPFMWTYLVVCMLALAASLFINRALSLGRFKLPLATVLILLVGLTYLLAVGLAYGIGDLKASWVGTNFIGKSTFTDPQSKAKVRMVSDLLPGYWLALYAGAALSVLGVLRRLFVGKLKA
ncbi:MAG: hypothetical protein LBE86_06945 [Gemmobacter sp.]|nr:hypothetical protein [Gemmobacter sp.]